MFKIGFVKGDESELKGAHSNHPGYRGTYDK
jgi:hypothetical protein